ncbi:hypothetical protein ANCCAN_06417 [Ancylostoma caninum]|uniref:Tyrosinase copper-binding domain-containing protein n=1 Tax=Ancylostoma caninum TaxID=29170 RepID=A0A368GWX3_ANCCA|nr:hypothetical protein ANCCAN_06417 [Ancylostoma caninum]
MVDHEVALPYWDPTLDYELSDPTYSVLWSAELMGEQDYDGFVRESPFESWTTHGSGIKRNVGDKGYLMKETDITTITDRTNEYEHIFAHTVASLDCPNPGYWSAIEYIGADPQLFVGGDMEDFLTASNDPLFWSLHAMVDLIWEQWRELYQRIPDRETQYPANDTKCSGPAHFRDSPMVPFNNIKIIDGLSNNYTHNLYNYDMRPMCNGSDSCGSKYVLFSPLFKHCTFTANVKQDIVLPKLELVVHAPIIAVTNVIKENARTTFASISRCQMIDGNRRKKRTLATLEESFNSKLPPKNIYISTL